MVKFKASSDVAWINTSLSWYGAFDQISKLFEYLIFETVTVADAIQTFTSVPIVFNFESKEIG